MSETNYDWFIKNNLDQYAGRWVAIDNNRVLESNLEFDSLLKKIKSKHPKSRPFITRIRNRLLRLHS